MTQKAQGHEYVFQGFKSKFNTKKIHLKKKYSFDKKKLKTLLKVKKKKSSKQPKRSFNESLKIKLFPKKIFFNLKTLFFKHNPKYALSE